MENINVKRKSNIELIRIIIMFMIIIFHCITFEKFDFETFTLNKFIVKFFKMFDGFGVNIYILITGYFMVKKRFNIKKLILLVLEAYFYNLFFYFIVCRGQISAELFLFPIIKEQYWFLTAYVLVYILIPFFNKIINSMNRIEMKKYIFTIVTLFSVIPTVFGVTINSTENLFFYNRFIWLCVMYFIGAYIRVYGINKMKNKKDALKYTLISVLIIVSSILIIEMFSDFFNIIGIEDSAYFWRPNSLPMLTLCVCFFCLILQWEIPYNRFINYLAKTTFGVYIFHFGFFKFFLFSKINLARFANSNLFVFRILYASIIIFVIGVVLDIFRQFIEKHTVLKIIESKKVKENLDKFNKFYNI